LEWKELEVIPVRNMTTRGDYSLSPTGISISEIHLDKLIEELINQGCEEINITHKFAYTSAKA